MKSTLVFLSAALVLVIVAPTSVAQEDCPSYLTDCMGICVDPNWDVRYCGCSHNDPGTYCPSGYKCHFGVCVLECPMGQVACDGFCVSTSSDEDNCGACGNICPEGYLCEGGQCVPCAPVPSSEISWGIVKSSFR